MDVTTLELHELQKVFYTYFLEIQINRRQEALKLFEEKKFNEIRTKYPNYYVSNLFHIDFDTTDLQKTIDKLIEIKEILPENVDHIKVGSTDDGLRVSYFEVAVDVSKKCEKVAQTHASNLAWQLKYQPNGKQGKEALILYEKLIG
jgi:hypothetical protein